jgi:hypothetical protein
MKNSSRYFMILMVSLLTFSTPLLAAEKSTTPIENNTAEAPAAVKVMLNRLDEIKAMDKSELNSSDKKELRKEVRAIKASLRASNNGVYLSVGAIIIIVLLLILLL